MPAALPYVLSLVAFLVVALIATLMADRFVLHQWLNDLNGRIGDKIFLVVNEGAEVAGICLALLIGLLWKFRVFFTVGIALAINGLVTQALKHWVFHDFMRPYHYFKEQGTLNVPLGVELHESFSMPSGHTSTAFAMCFALLLYTNDKRLWALLTVLAFGMGYARVYLSQHFLADVFAGAILGIISALASYYLINRKEITDARKRPPRSTAGDIAS